MVEAVLLVGGRGTRLRPLTVNTPKPMLPTAGVPFLHHVLARAAAAGVDHVVLATSYRPEVFRNGLAMTSDGSLTVGGHRLRIDLVSEDEPMGTGGGIRNVASLLECGPDEPVVILNGDVLSGHDLAAQVAAHVSSGADATLHLTEVDDARAFGCVPTDTDGRVTAFLEKTPEPVTNRVNAGCYVFRRSVIDAIPAGRPVSVERETFPGLVAGGSLVIGHVDPAYWLNLEHGYTILWYDDTIKGGALDDLKDISASARKKDPVAPGDKFIVSAWDDAYGKLPAGKHVAMSHWGAQDSNIRLCGKVSGAAVDDFITAFPASDSPEPSAQ